MSHTISTISLLFLAVTAVATEATQPYQQQSPSSSELDKISYCQQRYPAVEDVAEGIIREQLRDLEIHPHYANRFLQGSSVEDIRVVCPHPYYSVSADAIIDNNELLSHAKEKGLNYLFVSKENTTVAILTLEKNDNFGLQFSILSSGPNADLPLSVMKKLTNYPELLDHYEFRVLVIGITSSSFQTIWLKGSEGREDKIIPLFGRWDFMKNEFYTEQQVIDVLKEVKVYKGTDLEMYDL